ncbi:MAG: DUF885 domain-containing protein [Chitinophagaceae bacterium]|nr:MAG: DUF885 domain-containing protein [Chitinophagaceae bacterium]
MNHYQLSRGVTALVICFILHFTSPAQQAVSNPALASATTKYWKDFLLLNPMTATSFGLSSSNDKLENNISAEFVRQSKALCIRYLDSVSLIRMETLDEADRLVLKVFRFTLNRDIDGLDRNISYGTAIARPVDQFVFSFLTGFATLASGRGAVPFRTVSDYDNWLSRLQLFPAKVDTAISNMSEGIRTGNTVPRAAMLKVPAQLKPLYDLPADSSIFFLPVLNMPGSFSDTDKERLTAAFRKTIDSVIRPAYRRINAFIEKKYIPAARTTSGLLDNAGGAEEYKYFIRFWTTSDMDPQKIFELGLSEVARIRKEMDSIRVLTGFKGDLPAFFTFIKTDPRFFPFKTEEEVLARYASFRETMKPGIEKMFALLPRSDFEIRATEKFRQKGANAQYMRGSADGTRKGVFYEVIPDPLAYNYSEMETLFLHEAIPGHHFQVALQLEMKAPEFMKASFFGAFSEGWGLYAETLGGELGMYTDPYQYFGRLVADMERSLRLVVDVGMHFKGWSRDKAIRFLLDNQPVTKETAEQRIERYMVIPAQALSYKIGEQKILQLRRLAMDQLGLKFTLAGFHDQVLKNGAIPLELLDEVIREWIEREIKK